MMERIMDSIFFGFDVEFQIVVLNRYLSIKLGLYFIRIVYETYTIISICGSIKEYKTLN